MSVANFVQHCCNNRKDGVAHACCTSKMARSLALQYPHPAHIERQAHQAPLARYFIESA
jgi:hypothetical protein